LFDGLTCIAALPAHFCIAAGQLTDQQQASSQQQLQTEVSHGSAISAASALASNYAELAPFVLKIPNLDGLKDLPNLVCNRELIPLLQTDTEFQIALVWLCQSVSVHNPRNGGRNSIFLRGQLTEAWQAEDPQVLLAWIDVYAPSYRQQFRSTKNKTAMVTAI